MPTNHLNIRRCLPESIHFSSDGTCSIQDADTNQAIEEAAALLRADKLVAFPTETVYGLGASALSSAAVQSIYSAKGRPSDNPLIIHIHSLSMLERYIPPNLSQPVPAAYQALIEAFWPGPLTLLYPLPNFSPFASEVVASLPTIAVRMPAHPVARALIQKADRPIAAPSANVSGRPSPTDALHVYTDMLAKHQNDPDWHLTILDGDQADVGLESTVVDGVSCEGEVRVLRLGGVGSDAIQDCLRAAGLGQVKVRVYGKDWQDQQLQAKPSTPGMKYRHYAPSCPVLCVQADSSCSTSLMDSIASSFQSSLSKKIGLLHLETSHLEALCQPCTTVSYSLGSADQPAVHAARLFDGLRNLEQQGVDLILVERPEDDFIWESGIGSAVWERVGKAGGGLKSSLRFRP